MGGWGGSTKQGRPHLAETKDGQGLADEGNTHVLAALPLAALHGGVGLGHIAAKGCHERNAVLCCSHCVGSGRIDHQAPVLQAARFNQ